MTGLFEREVGDDWETLHPRVRERYGLEADEDRIVVGVGRMTELDRNPLAVPIRRLGTLDDFLFPEGGSDVPFTITTEAFVDDAGNEALFLHRRFETSPPRAFVDTLRWNPERGCLTDLFGRRGHVAADVRVRADNESLALSIGTQWLRARGTYVALPNPLSVDGHLRDWYDDDADRFRVAAESTNPLVGTVFGYTGTFESDFRPTDPDAATRSALGGIDLPGENA
ncbi:DUF4166 domain-containing protein [Natrinema halophilum]|uniref:DUF4166 domain-containing protein n=1 Tax=Natrinema halophilum TaxID=1699371 RepID=A0A7D5L3G2_9EURY|nr:DUF4166 domain-containing protein [Natrinema halophilum]QLG49685.1 DUF4166 domain-containing protein [Natrinema halophilum]